jgi:hypothetical protein
VTHSSQSHLIDSVAGSHYFARVAVTAGFCDLKHAKTLEILYYLQPEILAIA